MNSNGEGSITAEAPEAMKTHRMTRRIVSTSSAARRSGWARGPASAVSARGHGDQNAFFALTSEIGVSARICISNRIDQFSI